MQAQLDQLNSAYNEAKANAVEALQQQINKWDELEIASDVTTKGITKGYQSQAEYMSNYVGNMESLMGRNIEGLSDWVKEQCATMSRQESELLERLNDYMDEADRSTIAEMTDEDAKLSLFVSIQKGCGKQLLQTITQEFKEKGLKRVFLWTDTSCSHGYYPTHGFSLASEYRDRHYSTPDVDYMTYIYWKPIE